MNMAGGDSWSNYVIDSAYINSVSPNEKNWYRLIPWSACWSIPTPECWSAAWKEYTSAPTSNLCNVGNPWTVQYNPSIYNWYFWFCNVWDENVDCYASKKEEPVAWSCWSATDEVSTTQPTSNLCNAWTASDVEVQQNSNGSLYWKWTCKGSSNATCTARIPTAVFNWCYNNWTLVVDYDTYNWGSLSPSGITLHDSSYTVNYSCTSGPCSISTNNVTEINSISYGSTKIGLWYVKDWVALNPGNDDSSLCSSSSSSCSDYTLTSCPDYGVCSSCPSDSSKKRLDSCEPSSHMQYCSTCPSTDRLWSCPDNASCQEAVLYHKSGNTCVGSDPSYRFLKCKDWYKPSDSDHPYNCVKECDDGYKLYNGVCTKVLTCDFYSLGWSKPVGMCYNSYSKSNWVWWYLTCYDKIAPSCPAEYVCASSSDGYNDYYAMSDGNYCVRNEERGWETTNEKTMTCFPAWTQVHMADGSVSNIEDIEVWDMVLTYNIDSWELESHRVFHKFVHENADDELYEFTINWNVLKVTEAHRFYITRNWFEWENENQCTTSYRWVEARDLQVWDQILMKDRSLATIENIVHHPNYWTVYNLWVENVHNYFVDEWYLVHNAAKDKEIRNADDTGISDTPDGILLL